MSEMYKITNALENRITRVKGDRINMENLIEFIKELRHNQQINFEKDLENRVNIDYVLERLEDCVNMEMLELLDVESEDLNKELKDCGIKPLKPLKTND